MKKEIKMNPLYFKALVSSVNGLLNNSIFQTLGLNQVPLVEVRTRKKLDRLSLLLYSYVS